MDNKQRADVAKFIITEHARRCSNLNDDDKAQLGDLLTNLMHFAKKEELDFEKVLSVARMHFENESN